MSIESPPSMQTDSAMVPRSSFECVERKGPSFPPSYCISLICINKLQAGGRGLVNRHGVRTRTDGHDKSLGSVRVLEFKLGNTYSSYRLARYIILRETAFVTDVT